jgi:D-alanyl-D-alanine carboxypeptidase
VYDLYLIFNKAITYDMFREIIHMDSYSTVFQDSAGNDKEMSFSTTNLFLRGDYDAPDKVTIIGGKTGTTNAALNCLIILSKDTAGNPYISVILRSKERQILYEEMIDLLEEIYN